MPHWAHLGPVSINLVPLQQGAHLDYLHSQKDSLPLDSYPHRCGNTVSGQATYLK